MGLFNQSRNQSEVEYLRGLVKELHEKLMAYADRSFQQHMMQKELMGKVNVPTFVDPLGQIQNMEVTSKEEAKARNDALDQARQILGAA